MIEANFCLYIRIFAILYRTDIVALTTLLAVKFITI